MPIPAAAYPLIGGAISALGSLFGGRQSNKANDRIARRQEALQKEFAQHGIRWKVEDAKAAGLHPLFALGSQPAQYSPVAIQDSMGPAISDAGQHIGRAVAATSTREERQLQSLAIQEAISRIGETDARRDYYLSEAARNAQFQAPGIPHENAHPQFGGVVSGRTTPSVDAPVITHKPGDTALVDGPTPLWRQFTIAGGVPIVLPGGIQGDAAEVLESVMESFPAMIAVYKENKERFGNRWADWFLQRYMPFGNSFVKRFGTDRPRRFESRRSRQERLDRGPNRNPSLRFQSR